jgi:hypothetical protein
MADNKKTITKQIPTQRTRADIVADSFNQDDRTVEITFATETAVRTFDWDAYEMVDEVLVCEPDAGDLTRLNSGGPVLDNHNRWGKTADVVVGVIVNARFENATGIAKIRFGNSEDDTKLMDKVRDGIITGVSVGYNVSEYQVTRTEGKRPQYRATKWEATEISFTPVQADVNSRVRNNDDQPAHEVTIEDVTPEADPITEPVADPAPDNTDDTNPDNTDINIINDSTMTEEEKRAAAAAEAERTRAAAKQERERIAGIRKHTRALGLTEAFADTLIDDESVTDLAIAGQRALTEWEKLNPVNAHPNVEQQRTEREGTRAAMANALVLRITPNAAAVMGEENVRAASDFRGMSLLRMAEEALLGAGTRTKGMTPREIAVASLGGKVRGMHHTTDFPLLLMSTVNRTLLAQYALQERTFQSWARRTTLKDFRPVSRVRLSEILGDLEKVREGEEYKYGTLSEAGETYQLAKYGKIIAITWEAIVNDDLSAFDRIPMAFAVKAANLQTELVYKTILASGFAVMSDGNALFSLAHKNFVGTAGNQTTGGSALSEATLSAAYTSFREQKGLDGSKLNLKPKFLVVGPKNEFLAQKLTSTNFTATKQSDTPVGSLTGLTLIVDAEIENYEWFLIADPNTVDTVEYAFLDGEEELFIEEREGFNIDGIEVKARTVFAAKAIDWRGVYRNNGAAPA